MKPASRGALQASRREVALVAILALVAALTTWVTTYRSEHAFALALVGPVALAFFAARLLTLRLPQGQEVCITTVVALYALGTVPCLTAVLASLVAGIVDLAARFQQSDAGVTGRRALDVVRSSTVLGLAAPSQLVLQPLVFDRNGSNVALIAGAAVGLLLVSLDLATLTAVEAVRHRRQWAPTVRGLAKTLGAVYLVHIAMGVSAISVQASLGASAFVIALLLTLILQNSFNLYLRIRRAYAETIGALARAAELDRPQDAGHAQRVSELAVSVGRRMGFSGGQLERLRYAALLHDIGRLGASQEGDENSHALRGAEIVTAIPFLADAASVIRDHHATEDPPLMAAVIGVCSHYDRLRMNLSVEQALRALTHDQTGVRLTVARELESLLRAGGGIG